MHFENAKTELTNRRSNHSLQFVTFIFLPPIVMSCAIWQFSPLNPSPSPPEYLGRREPGYLGWRLRQQFLNHLGWFDTGQLGVEAVGFEGQAFVVEAEQVQHGGVEVANVDRVFRDVVREVAGLAVNRARLDAAAGHPHGEAARMMVAAVVLMRQAAL